VQTESLPGRLAGREQHIEPPHHDFIQHKPAGAQRPPFDGVTIGLHWTTAIVVLALLTTAWLHAIAEEQDSGFAPSLLQIHRSLGVTVWAVAAFRLAWRLTWARLPPFPAHMGATHRAAVKLSEYALYALLLVQPASGLLATLFGGRPFALFMWQIPALFPRAEAIRDAFHSAHELGAWMLVIMVAGHAGMALFHHFVVRDDVLACMAPGVAAPRARKEFWHGK
jgi:superoxide oxidase